MRLLNIGLLGGGVEPPKTEVVCYAKTVKIFVERFSWQSVSSGAGILADDASKPSRSGTKHCCTVV